MESPHTRIGSSRRRSSQMPTGKRASMREGPLAALFRKTAEDTAASNEGTARKQKQQRPLPEAEPRPDRHAPPHPALDAPERREQERPAPDQQAEPHIPSPQERLRHA